MKSVRFLAIANFLALALHIVFSTATQFKWVNTIDVAQVSNMFPTLFTPAGITFAIWGVIYFALLAMCVYHIVISFTKDQLYEGNKVTSKIGPWFIINNIATAAWLYVWTHQMIATAEILILVQLSSLIIIHGLLGIQSPDHSLVNKILTQAPLSIYLGWISIATIANTAVYLKSIGWSGWGFSETSWTLFMIGAAIFITTIMIFFRNNILFAVVVLWALWGIILKQEDLLIYHASIINAAWIGIAFIGTAILIQAFRMQHHPGEMHVIHGLSPEKSK
jgi:hypothetical protein